MGGIWLKNFLLFASIFPVLSIDRNQQSYIAATLEYEPICHTNVSPQDIMLENANILAQYARIASSQGVEIIVFPEYGLIQDFCAELPFSREGILPLFHEVPNPRKLTWNPCLQPKIFNNTQVLNLISCAAHNNSIAIVANLLSIEPCSQQQDSHCPSDKKYLYNTNVVFDKDGTLIARYHKKHLFFEALLNSPIEREHEFFQIGSVNFTTIIGFDALYYDPTVEIVAKKEISNIIIAAAWVNEMPFLLSQQFFSSWAKGLGINVLVSGLFNPKISPYGAGIYSSQIGDISKSFSLSLSKGTIHLSIVPIKPDQVPEDNIGSCFISRNGQEESAIKRDSSFFPTSPVDSESVTPYHMISYQSLSNFSVFYLDDPERDISLCHGGVCCHLTYNLQRDQSATFALLAFDGIQSLDWYKIGIQICSVVRCKDKGNINSCGRTFEVSSAKFNRLSLTAHLDARTVFPSVMKSDLQLLSGDDWAYSNTKCKTKTESKIKLKKPISTIHVASIYGRMYERDDNQIEHDARKFLDI